MQKDRLQLNVVWVSREVLPHAPLQMGAVILPTLPIRCGTQGSALCVLGCGV